MPYGREGQAAHGRAGTLFLIGEGQYRKNRPLAAGGRGVDLDRVAVLDDVVIPDDLHTLKKAIHKVSGATGRRRHGRRFPQLRHPRQQQVRQRFVPTAGPAEKATSQSSLLRHFIKQWQWSFAAPWWRQRRITAMVRSQLKLFHHPERPEPAMLIHDSATWSATPSLLFEVVPVESNAVRLEWHGKCNLTVRI